MHYVYVTASDGTPLMPTTRYGKVHRMLKSGQAVAVRTKPFTIRLIYTPKTQVTQPVTLGIDPGRTNIGLAAVREDGACLYAAECVTRNKEIPKLMEERRRHRQASRRGERLARKRLAKRLGTTRQVILERLLPGYEKPVVVRDIINTEARFNNRRRPANWLTPTARQLLQTHKNLVCLVKKILPVTGASLEVNRFAFMDLEAGGKLKAGRDYQTGPMHGFSSDKEALVAQQGNICLLCQKADIEHVHHIRSRSKGGSDTLANKAGLCNICHDLVHKDQVAADKLEAKKIGLNKKYGALSVLNQIIPYLTKELSAIFSGNLYLTAGWETKVFRERRNIGKEHYADAYCIACASLPGIRKADPPKRHFTIRQFRCHDRQLVKAQTERTYRLDGVKVAANRKKRMDQKSDSLEDWREDCITWYGKETASAMESRLTVKKSRRRYNNPDRYLPGLVFLYQGKQYIMTGQRTRGRYLLAHGEGDKNFPARECHIIKLGGGLQYVS